MSSLLCLLEQVLPRDIARVISSYATPTKYFQPTEPPVDGFFAHLPRLSCMAMSFDTRWIFAGTEENCIYQWCTETGQLVWCGHVCHPRRVHQMLVSRDGTFLLSSGGNRVIMWNLSTKRIIDSVEISIQVSGFKVDMALSDDARTLYVLYQANRRLTRIPLNDSGFGVPQDLVSLPTLSYIHRLCMGVLPHKSGVLISDDTHIFLIQDQGTTPLVSIVSCSDGSFFFPDAVNQLVKITKFTGTTFCNQFQIVEPFLYVLSDQGVLYRWHLSAIHQPPTQVKLPDWQTIHFCVSSDHRFLLGFCDWLSPRQFLQRRELITFVDSQ